MTIFDFDKHFPPQPIEVWRAVEGDRAALIALLRSGESLTPQTREAMADWLEGKLNPVALPKGRPPKDSRLARAARRAEFQILGHDTHTLVGAAGWRYDWFRAYIRKRGWHKRGGIRYWSQTRLAEAIAERYGIETDALLNYLRRPKKPPPKPTSYSDSSTDNDRMEIALEIRRTKMGIKN